MPESAGTVRSLGNWHCSIACSTLNTNLQVTVFQVSCAGVFLAIGIRAFLDWDNFPDTKVPAWPLICAVHLIFYGIAIFSASRVSPSFFDFGSDLSDDTLSKAMGVGLLGLISIGAGRTIASDLALTARLRPRLLEIDQRTPLRTQIFLLAGIATNVAGLPFYGTAAWNLIVVLFSVIPMTAFLWIVLSSSLHKVDQLNTTLAGIFFLTRIASGATFGASLGTIAVPVLLVGLAVLSVKHRLPWRSLCLVVILILFLQPSKIGFRNQIAAEGRGNVFEALKTWTEAAYLGWLDVFSGHASLAEQLKVTASRSSLLTLTGVILEKTPDFVPYQYGASYPLLLQNLTPRIFWPDKPSVNVSNQFYQVQYGLTSVSDLSLVSIASGFEAEGYMNFGWVGVVMVGLLIGAIVRFYECAFFAERSPSAATAVGLVLLPGFLTIESQLVQYIGGISQIIVAAYVVFHDRGRLSTK